MKDRNVEFFNLSFLDLLSGALAAIIFLFLIVPKGNLTIHDQPLVITYDTLQNKFFGEIPDSLRYKQEGDTLLAVIAGFEITPSGVKTTPKSTPTPQPKQRVAERKEDPKPQKSEEAPKITVTQSKFTGSKPDVPCMVSIELKWDDKKDNVDLFVCKDNDCVYGGRRYRNFIGAWDSGKSRTSIFGGADFRTNQEAVRQFDAIIPGEYEILAQYKESDESPKSNLPMRLQVYTKNDDGVERGKEHYFTLSMNPNDRTRIARVVIGQDGDIDFQSYK